jgi:tetratricopeptide (TPR) repeat protein
MKIRSVSIIVSLFLSSLSALGWCDTPIPASNELIQGVQAYQQDRWMTALGHFVHVLAQDPANAQAHTYLSLILKKLEAQQVRKAHEDELAILTATSKLLEDRRMDTRIVDEALHHSNAADADRERYERHAQCTMAQMEAQLGHLAVANDLVLQVLAQNSNDQEAQQLLSQLQSQIRQTLDTKKDLPIAERHALEGFWAYGQADYSAAAAAWGQVRSALEQGRPPEEVAQQIALFHFNVYDQNARAHLEEERQAAHARSLFAEGLAAYDKQDFNQSLEDFRQIALVNPEYPRLGFYLVQSEAAVERQRTRDLTDEKRQQATTAFAKGVANLAKGKYADAQAAFQTVLALDPNHPQARQYMQQIETQKNRLIDPQAAQQHFEAGLVAYAAGDSEQAVREWHIAQRLDPDNPKIVGVVNKVERELVMSKEFP